MADGQKFTFSMMEYLFYHEGMTIEEWKEERQYMVDHMDDVKKAKFKPLWKQEQDACSFLFVL